MVVVPGRLVSVVVQMKRRGAGALAAGAAPRSPAAATPWWARGIIVDPTIKRIGVPALQDTTGKPALDQKITQKVIEELLKRGRFDVVQDAHRRGRAGGGRARCATTRAPVGFSEDAARAAHAAPRPAATRSRSPRASATRRSARPSRSGPTTPSRSATSTTSAPTPPPSSTARSRPSTGWPRRSRAAWWRRCSRRSEGGGRAPRRPRHRRAPTPTWPRRRSRGCCAAAVGSDRGDAVQVFRGDETTWAPRAGRGAHAARCSRRGGRWWCATRTRSRARATSCAAYLDDPTPGRRAHPDGGQARQAQDASGSALLERGAGGRRPSRCKGRAAARLRGRAAAAAQARPARRRRSRS